MKKNNISIRKAQHTDAEAIITAHVRSIREICAHDYTPEQIDAWSNRNFKPELWQQTMDRDIVWIVEKDEVVQGFAHLAVLSKDLGEVMGLYLTPEVKGLGAGKLFMSEIIKTAEDQNLVELQLHSTITAKSFYESQGFKQSGSDATIEMRGVAIPCFPMSYFL